MTHGTDLFVSKADLASTRLEGCDLSCGDGEVLLRIAHFALTANNITYAVAGDSMGYWNFFPAPEGWGRVPVWGFAEVVESKHADVATGERVYGYVPMSTHLKVQPVKVSAKTFVDGAQHRASLPAVYNQYQRVAAQSASDEHARMLLNPLYMTSFLIDDFLADNHFFGARSVVLSSASSKTSLGLAFELHRKRGAAVDVVGLTSKGNVAFTESTGYYDRVLTYEALDTLDAATASVFVDMAGNGNVLRRVHEHFGDALRHSCLVGATHWQGRGGAARATLPGPKPELFFAPSQIAKRSKEWGPDGFRDAYDAAWAAFLPDVERWLEVRSVDGLAAARAAYAELLEGNVSPSVGLVVRPGA
ncbi:MAG: DUF2855 family protein [Gammaproteobacteria bacterium]|nr:DUF2855 family protein [Gammaproteobacteria bacterium]